MKEQKEKKSFFFLNHRGVHTDHSLSVHWSARLSVSHNYTSSVFLGFFAHQPLPKHLPPSYVVVSRGRGAVNVFGHVSVMKNSEVLFNSMNFDPCPSKFLPLPILPILIFGLYETLSLPLPSHM